ncbi:fibronectin type III domain-containing protein [Dehalogenimonas sp. THU2]|uniref:InlB B-repeat-containing protein n=1 Tax=Dehalogenimonas sp. THU2 TaxID=3151121 RepID=UPI00321882C3
MRIAVKVVLTFLLLASLLPGITVRAQPQQPYAIDGSVTIDGSPAPDGSNVQSSLGVSAGTSGGSYSMDIPADAANPGDSISFTVNGIPAGSGTLPERGLPVTIDLSITSPPPTFSLTIQVSGNGSVSPSSGDYEQNSQVVLTAYPASGWVFISWTGEVADPNTPSTSILMNSDKTIVANFEETPPVPTYLLTIQKTGEGTVNPAVGAHSIDQDSRVTVTAAPAAGWRFAGWTGNVASPSQASTTIDMDSDQTIIANFVLLPDETPPLISGVQAIDITKTSATITWNTDEEAAGAVDYSPGALTSSNAALVTSHSATLSGLTPATTYTFKVRSTDGSGNQTASGEFSFTTLGSPAVFETSGWRFDVDDTPGGGKQLTVEFTVANEGDVSGAYQMDLLLNNAVAETRSVVLEPGADQVVSFIINRSAVGSYLASINGFEVNFSVPEDVTDNDSAGRFTISLPLVLIAGVIAFVIIVGLFLLNRKYYLFPMAPRK